MANPQVRIDQVVSVSDLVRTAGWILLAIYVVGLLVAQRLVVQTPRVLESERAAVLTQQFQENEHIVSLLRDISTAKTSDEAISILNDLYRGLGLSAPDQYHIDVHSNGGFSIQEDQKRSRTSF